MQDQYGVRQPKLIERESQGLLVFEVLRNCKGHSLEITAYTSAPAGVTDAPEVVTDAVTDPAGLGDLHAHGKCTATACFGASHLQA